MWIEHSDPLGGLENVSPTHIINMTHINLLQDLFPLFLDSWKRLLLPSR